MRQHQSTVNKSTSSPMQCGRTFPTISEFSCDSLTTNNIGTHSSYAISSSDGASTLHSTSIESIDEKICTITVLNGGNELMTPTTATSPSKRGIEDTQQPGSTGVDMFLSNFSDYIKSEHSYDQNAFSSDGCRKIANSEADHISLLNIQNQAPALHALSELSAQAVQIRPYFAESLLRRALQGKTCTESSNLSHSNRTSLLPAPPSNKNNQIIQALYLNEENFPSFEDRTLSSAQIFEKPEDYLNANQLHNTELVDETSSNSQIFEPTNCSNISNFVVEDMFRKIENGFSSDLSKKKCIAREMQRYCDSSATTENTSSMVEISHTLISKNTATITAATKVKQHQEPEDVVDKSTLSIQMSTISERLNTTNAMGDHKSDSKTLRNNCIQNAENGTNKNNITVKSNTNTKTVNVNNSSENSKGNGNVLTLSSKSNDKNSSPTTNCTGQRKERSLHYCAICAKGFKDKYSVNVHIRTHTGEKPFACSICGKSFRQKAHLAKHYQTHITQKHS